MALRQITCLLVLATLLAQGFCAAAESASPQVILLKLDDVTAPMPRWQRVVDFIETNKLKASFGVIGSSLEKDRPAYFDWIKNLHNKGQIEFWLHGYRNRKPEDKTGEFETGTWEEQKAILQKCERLAKEKLGFEFKAFGPHWTGTTDETDRALEAVPEVTIWLYGPKKPKYFSRLNLERVLSLENPTFVPDFEKFKTLYARDAASCKVLVLQGHPPNWTDQRWEGFVKIVEFLRTRGCVFMTPSEYAATLQTKSKAQ